MSLEQKVAELTEAINALPERIAEAMGNQNSGSAKAADAQPAEKTSTESSGSEKESSSGEPATQIAGRKTYVWDKDSHTGQVVEKGEEMPVGENLVNLGKKKWDEACEKYGLDPQTGQPKQQESDDDGLDDELDQELSGGEGEDAGEQDDDGLGLDDDEDEQPELTKDEVKKKLIEYMKSANGGRENVLKLLKKHGFSNADDVTEDKFQALYDSAQKLINEA